MKKPIVIPLKKLIQKIMALSLAILLTAAVFSLKIPQKICRIIASDLLTAETSFTHKFTRMFSFHWGDTVYAAIPLSQTYEALSPISQQKNRTDIAPPQSPQMTPPPETDLAKSTTKKQDISLKNHTGKSFDIPQLLNSPLSYQADSQNYKVLLVHTHTTECYFPNDRSNNAEENMVAVGKEFQKILEQNGIPTLHITTVHDVPYTTSYKKSLESVTKALAEHPSIEVVIDLHRDAIYGTNGEKVRPIANINGTDHAQVMLVCGTDEGGLPHPDWKENLAFAVKVQSKMQEGYPNLARPLDLRKERFNTHTTKKSVIFEIGSHGNTLEEAILGAKLAAQAVSDVLNSH